MTNNRPTIDDVEFVDRRYGKHLIRLLHVRRDGIKHYVTELEVDTYLTLNDAIDYVTGDNSKVIATDSQKNTVYALAKQFGIRSIEEFARQLCNHFLTKYSQVEIARVHVEQKPWKRIQMDGKEHNHAFIDSKEAIRFCAVEVTRNCPPRITAGLKDMKVMKTTQSAFMNFVRDEYRTLPDAADRVFCTMVTASWKYNSGDDNLDYNTVWKRVQDTILEAIVGPPDKGVYSPGVQQTIYSAQKLLLERIRQISEIEIILPNIHAYEFDFSRLPKLEILKNNEVFQPTDKPSGNIRATLKRKLPAKL